jgi:hypothetical protein
MMVHMGMIVADLPGWLDTVLFGLSLVLPPVTLLLPASVKALIRNALVDVSNQINGDAAKDGLMIRGQFSLPGTAGPTYLFDPRWFFLRCIPSERSAWLGANLRPISAPSLRLFFEDQAVTVADNPWGRSEIRRDGGLPLKITARLVVPPGLIQRRDPTLRVRFETYLNDKPVPAYTRDLRYFQQVSVQLGGPITATSFTTGPSPTNLDIDTITMVSPTKLDQEVRITCRLYRSAGGITEDLFNKTVYIQSVDPRPDAVKPYVQWAHRVTYSNGFRKRKVVRRSKIHRVPGKGGCRFSDQYLRLPGNPAKFVSLRRFTGLPFAWSEIENNRDKVCPYCFFGGPDKHPIDVYKSKYDLTGAVAQFIRPA